VSHKNWQWGGRGSSHISEKKKNNREKETGTKEVVEISRIGRWKCGGRLEWSQRIRFRRRVALKEGEEKDRGGVVKKGTSRMKGSEAREGEAIISPKGTRQP